MGLRLQTVAAAQGLRWVREGLVGFLRWPLAYSLLFVMFMVVISLLSLLPLLGGPLLLMGTPLLGLGFTMAAHAAQRDVAPHPRVYLAAWRGQPKASQRALLTLCVGFAVAAALVVTLGQWMGADRFFELMDSLQRGQASPQDIDKRWNEDGVVGAALGLMGLFSLLSLVFWHAPTLVVWGGQSAGQALFSSALALWRNRAAFALYTLGWTGVVSGAGLLAGLLLPLLGQGVMGLLLMPLATALAAAFYVSLYPCYRDSFGAPDATG